MLAVINSINKDRENRPTDLQNVKNIMEILEMGQEMKAKLVKTFDFHWEGQRDEEFFKYFLLKLKKQVVE